MSITPSPIPRWEDESKPKTVVSNPLPPGGSGSRSRLPLILLAILLVTAFSGLFLYAKQLNDRLDLFQNNVESSLKLQGETLQLIAGRLEETEERQAELGGEFSIAKDRLGFTEKELRRARQVTSQLSQQQKESTEKLVSELGQLHQEQTSTKGTVGNLSTDVVEIREEVKSTQDELDSTRSQLQGVIGDLGVQSDLIAHNSTELVELRQRGDRDYFEFDLRKAKRGQRVGPVQLRLRKTDVKRQKYTIYLIADDRTIEKKDKTVFEPVQFYLEGNRYPTEVVVSQIYKDRIVGYVSAPKRKDERTPMRTSS